MNKTVMTVSEVAEYLKISDKTILKMIKTDQIPCARVGKQWRFDKQILDRWFQSQMNEAGDKFK